MRIATKLYTYIQCFMLYTNFIPIETLEIYFITLIMFFQEKYICRNL